MIETEDLKSIIILKFPNTSDWELHHIQQTLETRLKDWCWKEKVGIFLIANVDMTALTVREFLGELKKIAQSLEAQLKDAQNNFKKWFNIAD